MAVHNDLGHLGEELALCALLAKGYQLVCRNFRCMFGELDLVMLDSGSLVFVEVRSRSAFSSPPRSTTHSPSSPSPCHHTRTPLVLPLETLTPSKILRMKKTAAWYLRLREAGAASSSGFPGDTLCRFDCICVTFFPPYSPPAPIGRHLPSSRAELEHLRDIL